MKYLAILFFLYLVIPVLMSQDDKITVQCDPKTGLCEVPEFKESPESIQWQTDREIIYIGDPMCSWCWGISPQLNALKRYADSENLPFNIVMGGLRAGGGEQWNEDFKNFLKHHWKEVSDRSGQPFGYDLFELDHFDYDTEPACRAVVTVRNIAKEKVLSFYELTQHYFYVRSKDPKKASYYKLIC